MTAGRPKVRASTYDEAVLEELCARIAEGRGIMEVCRDEDMPSHTEVFRRMAKDEVFASRIARAREAQQDGEAERIVEMADMATAEDWQVVKMRIWARQWRAARLAPKKYGERTTQTIEGGEKPIEVREVTQTEIARRLAAILTDATKD